MLAEDLWSPYNPHQCAPQWVSDVTVLNGFRVDVCFQLTFYVEAGLSDSLPEDGLYLAFVVRPGHVDTQSVLHVLRKHLKVMDRRKLWLHLQ